MFDRDFMWGGGASSVATDGAGLRSDWYRWEETQHLERSDTGNDARLRYEEDHATFATNGVLRLRSVIEWARVEPFPGRLDREELEHIEHRLASAKDAGLAVWATLHHTSLPGWFAEDTDGFCTKTGPSIHWSRHVDRMAELFDPYVAAWVPIDDPIGWAVGGHHLGTSPGRISEEAFQEAAEGVVEALFDAHRLLASGTTPIVGNFGLPYLRPTVPEAEKQRRFWDDVFWTSWTKTITDGVLEWPWKGPVDRPQLAEAFDLIGLRLVPSLQVTPDGALQHWKSATRSDASGSTPVPEHLGEILQRAAEELDGRELVVTGVGAATDDDSWRAELLAGWLDQVASALTDGIPVRGVFLEPLVDGYDLTAGAQLDSGVISRSREPKSSFQWIAAQQ